MHRYYCTLFDKNYLYQGVALHDSLLATTREFTLFALAMDDEAFVTLGKLARESLVPIHVDDLLDEEVRAVRARTTHGQFCWVNQPLICQYLLNRRGIDMVTYLESDSYFFSDPEVLFDELGAGSVSLVPHNFSSEFDNSETAGRFCVQFNAFRNDERGSAVLADWRAANFRYQESAPSLYPGQTCIDAWPGKFPGVRILEHRGAGVAPWNVRGYRLASANGVPTVDGVPVVFYHYHQYGRLHGGAHELGSYPMTRDVIDAFYRPYVAALRKAERDVKNVDPAFDFRRLHPDSVTLGRLLCAPSSDAFRSYIDQLKRRLRGRFNVYPDSFFSANMARGGSNPMISPKSLVRRVARWLPLRWLPLDSAVRASQRMAALFARLLFIRDWQLETRGRPQFFKHAMNLAHWPFDPARWAFAARGVYARESMRRGCKVLDLCCGDGAYSRLFFADIAGRVDAVDLDEYAIAYARKYHSTPVVRYHRLDIIAEPLPDRGYDVVVWNAAICYFSEPHIRLVLQKVIAASGPDMKLFGMLPKANGWIDHKTEFSETAEVERYLRQFFAEVSVNEIDEGNAISFYFRARAPLTTSRDSE
jgi:SAM-dependent methyltransferase